MLKRADKTYYHIRPLALFIATVLCLCLVSCSSGNDTPGGEPDPILTINILAPAEQEGSLTRADVGTVPALENENRIYHIWVWAFLTGDTNGDNAVPVGSLYQELGGVLSTTCQMSISPDVVSGDKNLDIYVVANSEAIPSASFYMGHNITLGTIKNLVFGKATNGTEQHDDFGITTLQHTVPDGKGLPMSQYALGCEVIKASKLSKDVNITLRRAVSKLRFVFARSTGLPDVQVTGFTLDADLIPDQEYVFPDNQDSRTPHIPNSVGYNTQTADYSKPLDTEGILEADNPKKLTLGWYGPETAEAYTQRLAEAYVGYENSLYYGLTYLRETGKPLKGTIKYKLNADDTERSVSFQMAEANDFTRNHEYIVYAYFEGGLLTVTPNIIPWKDGGTVESTTTTLSNLEFESYNMYNDKFPKDYDDWGHNYVAVSFDTRFVSGGNVAPQFSPLIHLRTSDEETQRIQTNNPDFCFIVREPAGEGSYTYTRSDFVLIPSGTNVVTEFYVVPTHLFNMAAVVPPNPNASVFLSTSTSSLVVSRMPWNAVLPGSDDHTEIWFHYVSTSDYSMADQEGTVLKTMLGK